MDEIMYQKSYQEYKAELDGELQRTAEGFVRIGYLLKVARDTNVLAESGYKTVAEFAEAEYNLNKTQVSRFMSINDKFSEGGYSDRLMSNYQGYGYAKLTIMLQLPDSINEELSPSFSKAEIQSIREEIAEEAAVSDIERCLEGHNENEINLETIDDRIANLYKAILQLGEDEPELYVSISERKKEDISVVLPEIMAPAGDKMYSIRVRGIGRLMLSISDMSDNVKLINSRSGEKEIYSWADVAAGWAYAGVLGLTTEEQSGIECWEQRYERKYPIAPVQQKESKVETAWGVKKPETKKEPKKETKVAKATTDWASIYSIGQQVKVIANDHIGELIEKTEATGKWKIKFPTYTAEMHEGQFTEYEEEKMPEQLHDVREDIPEINEDVEEEEENVDCEEAIEEIVEDYNLPGQMSVEDMPGVVPEIEKVTDAEIIPPERFGMNPPIEEVDAELEEENAESYSSDYHPGKDPMVDALIDHTGKLCKHIISNEWSMALMDIDMLIDGINRAKAAGTAEEDE